MKLKCFFSWPPRLLLPSLFALWQESPARTEEYSVSGMAQVDTSGFKVNDTYLGCWG
jgi:hypothetical protein